MATHSFNTFSHANSYYPLDTERTNCSLCQDGRNKSINAMMQTPLNVTRLRADRLPLSDAYANFSTQHNGSVYTYIRDHLGYRLELVHASAQLEGGVLRLTLLLQNFGFSAPVNAREWGLVLLDARGEAAWSERRAPECKDWRTLYPHLPGDPLRTVTVHNVTVAAALNGSGAAAPRPGAYQLGFTLLDPLAKNFGDGGSSRGRYCHSDAPHFIF
jgi:hypothetical protein